MKEKNILFLLFNYPPEYGTAPKRNFNISTRLSKHFSQYFIVTKSKDQRGKIPQIISVNTFDYRTFLNRKYNSGYIPEKLKENLFIRFFIKLVNTFPFNLILGEGGGIYFITVFFKIKRHIRENRITHIYTSYRPITDHFIAYLLKLIYPKLIWIADFRDLIVDPHYKQQFLPKWHQVLYHKIFNKADLLTTISDGFKTHLLDYNPKAITVLNGIDIQGEKILPTPSDRFNIVYTGSMFLDERNPKPLLKVLKYLINNQLINENSLNIHYAGKDSAYWNELVKNFGLSKIFVDHGMVSSDEAQNLQNLACLNLVLTISSDSLQGVLTGKMIEYLNAGSPILVIIKNQNDPYIKAMIEQFNAGLVVSDHVNEEALISDFILELYQQWEKTKMTSKPIDRDYLSKSLGWETTLTPLYNFIDEKI